mgnify:CR=1 FL=1
MIGEESMEAWVITWHIQVRRYLAFVFQKDVSALAEASRKITNEMSKTSYLLLGAAILFVGLTGYFLPIWGDGQNRDKIAEELALGGSTSYDIVCFDSDNDDPLCYGGASGTITTATSTGAWRNLIGQEVWVDYTEMTLSRNASSSLYFVAGTSSVNSLVSDRAGFDLVSTRGQLLIASTSVATGTRPVITNENWPIQATTTNSNLKNPLLMGGQDKMSFPRTGEYSLAEASTSVRVANGEYVLFLVRGAAESCMGNQQGGGIGRICESATSTNRDPVLWKLRFHY